MAFTMRSIIKLTALLVAIGIVVAASRYTAILYSSLVSFSNLNEVEDNVFFDPAIGQADVSRLLYLLAQAEQRIEKNFAPLSSQPVVIFVKQSENIKKFGLDQYHVRARITPWGNYLLAVSDLKNNYALTHEYFHIETSIQLGYSRKKLCLPVWLDEGLAMQFDDRARYKLDKYPVSPDEIQRIKKLHWSKDFWTDKPAENIRNVLAAKAAVAGILGEKGSRAIPDLFEKVRQGQAIVTVFSEK